MNYLVGLTADSGGRDALALGRMLARTGDVTLTVCIVLPEVWGHPSLARVDAEYATFLASYAEDTIAEAREFIGDAVRAEYVSASARTATEGLVTTATQTDADLVVLGSARHGPFGRFAVGSVTNEMLTRRRCRWCSPQGEQPVSDARLRRVTCASPGRHVADAFDAAVRRSRRHGLPLRLTTLVVRDRQMYPSQVGYSAGASSPKSGAPRRRRRRTVHWPRYPTTSRSRPVS